MAKLPRYLFPSDYMADPSANVFNGRLYIYPSHDWEAGAAFDDDGGHFQMKDYHVLSWDDVENDDAVDHGVILDVKDVPWAEKQMWDNDCVEKDGKYYLIFSANPKARSQQWKSPSVAHSLSILVCLRMMMDRFIATSAAFGEDSSSGGAHCPMVWLQSMVSMVSRTDSSIWVQRLITKASSLPQRIHLLSTAAWFA